MPLSSTAGQRAAPRHRQRWLALAICLLLGTSLGAETAPDADFGSLAGETESLQDHRGKVVVLNLWATWCSPCLIEIPHLVELQSELDPEEATVIGLALDSGSADAIRRFWTRTLNIEPTYPLWLGTVEQAEALFDARAVPTTLIIDREGRIRERLLGLQTRQDLLAAIAPYL